MLYRFQAINEYYDYDSQIKKLLKIKLGLPASVISNWVYLNHEKVEIIYYFDNSNKYVLDMDKLKHIKRLSEVIFQGDSYNILQIKIDDKKSNFSFFMVDSTVYKPDNLFNEQVFIIFMVETQESYELIEKIKNDAGCIVTLATYIRQSLTKFERLYNMVDELVKILTEKDTTMPNHMTNVAHYCLQMALKMDFTKQDTNHLYLAGLLHDIGKLYIDESILTAERKLTSEEYELIKKHSTLGYSIAKTIFMDISIFGDVPKLALYHHENFDGSGYPMGLKGEDIPLFSRIIRICDSVDAMLARRQYKTPMGFSEVIMELKKYSGTHYDPELVNVMIGILKGSRLSDSNFKEIEGSIIPDISINMQLRTKEGTEYVTYLGNMIVFNNHNIEFISKTSKMISAQIIDNIEECKLFFMVADECFETDVDLKTISSNKIYLKNIRFGMMDNYFSLPWNSEAVMGFSEDLFVKMEMLLLGASMSILKVDSKTYSKIKEKIGKEAVLYIDESLDNIELKESIKVNIRRIYKVSKGMVFICDYSSVSENQRDRLFRLLLKKQAIRNKILHNVEL